ncbi:MAG: sulfurtransferase [Solirubrobacteraceae bacterium]|nr:sulfurtransferase [Solirubrobacteraceae bacterium]
MPHLPALVDVATLHERLGDPSVRVVDATVRFVVPPDGGRRRVESGRGSYDAAHVPGAVFGDLVGALSDPYAPFGFTVPDPDAFAAEAGRLGIGSDTHVVVYTEAGPMWATRLWWMLRYFGHDAVSVLDGGLTAWRAAGLPTEAGPVTVAPATFVARPRPERLASRAEVERMSAEGGTCLVNALSTAVFRGDGPSNYSRPGRIPGSVSAPWEGLVDRDTWRFRPLPELRAHLDAAGALGDEPVVAYCGGGISATVDLFALSLLGRDDARLYDGSLTEWSADPELPLETG